MASNQPSGPSDLSSNNPDNRVNPTVTTSLTSRPKSAAAPAHFQLNHPPTSLISAIKFSRTDKHLCVVSSWDSTVYAYLIKDEEGTPGGRRIGVYPFEAPVLDVELGETHKEAFVVGLDCKVWKYVISSIPRPVSNLRRDSG